MTEDDIEIGKIINEVKAPRPREELKELALGILDGSIFHSSQIRQHDMDLFQSIFMPLIFMDEIQIRMMQEAGAYSFYGKLSGRDMGINGYPMLMNMGWLTKEETTQLLEIYNKIQSTLKDI